MGTKRTVKLILEKLYYEYRNHEETGNKQLGLNPIEFSGEANIEQEDIKNATAFLEEKGIIERWEGKFGTRGHHLTYPVGLNYYNKKQYNQDFSWWKKSRFMERVRATKDIVTTIAALSALIISLSNWFTLSQKDEPERKNNTEKTTPNTAKKDSIS